MTIASSSTEADPSGSPDAGRLSAVGFDSLGMSFEDALQVLAATETPRRAIFDAA